ncbi:MAG: uracil-DNA glycosylase [Deltaproteobacteria bacterium]|nr:uracil-DNA glycosylase [Deltaproteobacteria bacterium]
MKRDDSAGFAALRERLELIYGPNAFVSKTWLRRRLLARATRPVPEQGPEPERRSAAAPASAPETLEAVRAELGDCRRCKLSATRKTIVFGEGSPTAELMFVGEGPGEQEDAQGRPFVGKAGQLLDKIIEAMGLKRSEVYIANVVKCRPPGNRTPEPDEAGACEPFLFRQLDAIKPKIVVALGGTALKALLHSEDARITRMRGKFTDYRGAKLMPTFHPSFLLRNPDAKKDVWEDMKKVMAELKK